MTTPSVMKVINDIIYSTPDRIRSLQNGLVPTLRTEALTVEEQYLIDSIPYRDPKKTIISAPKLFKDYYKDKYKAYFTLHLKDAIEQGYADPQILFADGVFIPWDLITVVHDFTRDYFVIDKVFDSIDFKVINFQNKIFYTDDGIIPDSEVLFSFDENGLYDLVSPKYIISTPNTVLGVTNILRAGSSVSGVGKLNIDTNLRVFPENFFCFNRDGKLVSPDIETYPLGVYKIDTTEDMLNIVVFYRKTLDYQKTNSLIPINTTYVQNMIEAYNKGESVKSYIGTLIEDISFNLTTLRNWDENYKDIVERIFKYNPLLVKDAYPSRVSTEFFTGAEMKTRIGGTMGMFYGNTKFKGRKYVSRVLIFRNGEAVTEYIKYYANRFEIQFMDVKDDDYFEFLYFDQVNDNFFCATIDKNNPVLPTDEFDLEELAIFTRELENPEFPNLLIGPYTAFPIDFSIEDGKIIMSDFYYNKPLFIASKNRYAYRRFLFKQDTIHIDLGPEFQFCYNPKQYLVFLNGRRLNPDAYFITCMRPSRPFNSVQLYSRYLLTPDDELTVYYVPQDIDDLNDATTETSSITFDQATVPFDINIQDFLYGSNSITFTTEDGSEADILVNNDGTITLNGWTKSVTLTVTKTYSNNTITEEGYFKVNKYKLPYPLSKDLYFIFNNGKKIPNEYLTDIGSDTIAINRSMDIGDITAVGFHDGVDEFDGLLAKYPSKLDEVIKLADADELNKLFNIFTTISEAEDSIKGPNFDRLALINEVIRDNWMSPGINYGIPVTYDYYTDMFIYQDSEGNYILPAMDATQDINIIEPDKK